MVPRCSLGNQWGEWSDVEIYPNGIDIDPTSLPTDRTLSDTPIKLTATGGFDSDLYCWYYSIDGEDWEVAPSKCYQGATFNAAAGDLLFNGWEGLNGRQIWIKAGYQSDCGIGIDETATPYSFTIRAAGPKIENVVARSTTCYDSNDGSLVVTFNRDLLPGETVSLYYGAPQPASITQLNANKQYILSGLAPGEYKDISVTSEINGSLLGSSGSGYKWTNPVTVERGPKLQVFFSSSINCYTQNLIITPVPAGNYIVHYQKDGGTWQQSSSMTLSDLPGGDYNVYISNNNCNSSPRDTVLEDPPNVPTITVTDNESTSGFGRADGSLSFEVDGGDGKGSCTLLNTTNGLSYTPKSSTGEMFDFTNLPAGNYTFSYINSKGCTTQPCYAEVLQPARLTATCTGTNITCNGNADGSIRASVSGGVLEQGDSYDYEWEKLNGTKWESYDSGSGTVEGLSPGTYRLTVSDESDPINETSSNSVTISEPDIVQFKGEVKVLANNLCYGDSEGRAEVSAMGGNGNYKALLYKDDAPYSDGEYYTGGSLTFSGGVCDMEHLPAGKYTVEALTDGKGCANEGTAASLTFSISQPAAPITAGTVATNTTGYGRTDGKIIAHIKGGTPRTSAPYYDLVWKDSEGNVITQSEEAIDADGMVSDTINGLKKDTYSLSISDGNGCSIAALTASVAQPDPLTVELTPVAVKCYAEKNGQISADIKGGVPGEEEPYYSLQWYMKRDGGMPDSLIADQHTAILQGAGAGKYYLKVADAVPAPALPNTAESAVVEVLQPPLFQVVDGKIGTDSVACYGTNDGSFYLQVAGGVPPYKLFYQESSSSEPFIEVEPKGDGQSFRVDSLLAAEYTVYVNDANGCYAKIDDEEWHSVNIGQPDAPLGPAAGSIARGPSGYGLTNGSFQFTLTGGTPPYQVEWRDSLGKLLSPTNGTSGGRFTTELENLGKGPYTLIVKDSRYGKAFSGKDSTCYFSADYRLEEPTELKASIKETHYISCHGESDGALALSVTGGVKNPDVTVQGQPYNIHWYKMNSDNDSTALPDINLSALPTGVYRVHIKDYSWIPNQITLTYHLVEPEKLIATATQADIICGQRIDVVATVTGGTAPYHFEWSTGDTTQVLKERVAGKYMVFVTDARGCQTTALSRISAPSDLVIAGTTQDPLCYKGTNGSIVLKITGGRAPYTCLWNTGATGQTLSDVPAGNYNVTVTDADGCGAYQEFTLGEPAPVRVSLGPDRVICRAQTAVLRPEFHDPKASYYWTGPDGFSSEAPSIEVNEEGTYTVLATDSNGCQAIDSVHVRVDDLDISSEIVVASEVFTGDTVAIVNLSDPVPESSKWLFPASDSVQVVEQSEFLARLVFKIPGKYQIGLRTFVGECSADNIQDVKANDADERDSDFFGESAIKSFLVTPNPNKGTFTVKVALNAPGQIRVRIVNIGTGIVMDDRRYNGQIEYALPYNLPLAGGVYAVLLEASSGYMAVKMIVN
ncbi:MAG: SprB repeat-containing protein [Tannerella sp.]|nr:SprB repeat-containing protein [Tannerella sp.]